MYDCDPNNKALFHRRSGVGAASTTQQAMGDKLEGHMQAIELETRIDQNGHIYLPEEFQHTYGKFVRLVVLMPEQAGAKKKRQPGSAKGVLKMLSEDAEHLDDFGEYMS